MGDGGCGLVFTPSNPVENAVKKGWYRIILFYLFLYCNHYNEIKISTKHSSKENVLY